MAIICNLKSQATLREYQIVDASLGYASVELRNPSASENPAAFEVPVSECFNVREITGDGETVEYPDHLRATLAASTESEFESIMHQDYERSWTK